MSSAMNVLALLKNNERYVFLYDDDSVDQLFQTLGVYAADPELSFSWYDAAVLSQRVRVPPVASPQTSAHTPHPPQPRWQIDFDDWPDRDAA